MSQTKLGQMKRSSARGAQPSEKHTGDLTKVFAVGRTMHITLSEAGEERAKQSRAPPRTLAEAASARMEADSVSSHRSSGAVLSCQPADLRTTE